MVGKSQYDNTSLMFTEAYPHLYNQSNVAVLVNSMSYYRDSIATRGELLKRILKEDDHLIHNTVCGLKFPTNDKLYDSFNRKIQQLHEAGIIKKIMDENKKFLDPKFYEKPLMTHKEYLETTWRKSFVDEPQVLTLKDLEFGFVIWLGSLALPLIIFIVEILFKFVDKISEIHSRRLFLSTYLEMKQVESKMKSKACFDKKLEVAEIAEALKIQEMKYENEINDGKIIRTTSEVKCEYKSISKEDDIETIFLED
jgi:hypothetical protein